MPAMQVIAKPGQQSILIKHSFDAPRARVFRAHTDPNDIPRWWGPRYLTTTVDRMDVRPGGIWRFLQHDKDGHEHAFHGVFHEVTPDARLVYTFEYEGEPGHVVLNTLVFEEHDGRTTLTTTAVFQSVEDRDSMIQSGMEVGVRDSMDRIAELLARR